MTEKTYNGWTNYETWNVKLWMDNDEGSYNYWTEQAQEKYDEAEADGTFTREEQATLDLSDALKDYFEQEMAEIQATGMWVDLLGAALSEVNWHEIAEHMIEDVDKEEEAEVTEEE